MIRCLDCISSYERAMWFMSHKRILQFFLQQNWKAVLSDKIWVKQIILTWEFRSMRLKMVKISRRNIKNFSWYDSYQFTIFKALHEFFKEILQDICQIGISHLQQTSWIVHKINLWDFTINFEKLLFVLNNVFLPNSWDRVNSILCYLPILVLEFCRAHEITIDK